MKGEFFDSYGKHPIHYNKHFLHFMNRNAVEWEHNKIQLQSAFSTGVQSKFLGGGGRGGGWRGG